MNWPQLQVLRRIPKSIWVLGFVSMLMDISSELIHSLLPVFLVTVVGASAMTIGLIEGAAEATAMIVKVFSGVLSDYWGKRKGLVLFGYGLGALSKPLFALATSIGGVFTARLIDRLGKGVRGAPRDALVADVVPPELRGAAYGLRQSLDTVGAFVGPVLAVVLMLLWANDFRAVFWVAALPAALAVVLLWFGVQEPARHTAAARRNPICRAELKRLGGAYWWVVAAGVLVTLARFSEAFLVLRALEGGLAIAWTPLVLVTMNLVYAVSAYPLGNLSDRASHKTLLVIGLLVLVLADLVLAGGDSLWHVFIGVALWGLHMGMTQGLLASMVAGAVPADRRGTAFGFFNLLSGVTMLIASALAGLIWDRLGSSITFYAGAVFCGIALAVLTRKQFRTLQ